MADDRSADDPVEEQAGAAEVAHRRQLIIGAGALVLLVLAAAVWLLRSDADSTATCTTAGTIGTPIADSSEAAFEAWFAQSGADASMGWVDNTGVSPPSLEDYERTSSTSWEWRYQENASVLVETSRRDDAPDGTEQWSVSGVNGCTYR